MAGLHSKGKRVPLPAFFLGAALVVETLFIWTLILACQDTFDCAVFWPTLSYSAAYKGPDRVLNLALSLQACVLFVFFLIAQTYYHSLVTTEVHYLMIGSGLLLCAILPWIAVFDEANIASGVPLDMVHYWLVVAALFLGGVWTVFSCERSCPKFLQRYMKLTWTVTGLSIVQWTFADSIYRCWLFNPSLEAVFEWTAVSLGLFVPYMYSQTFPKCEFWTS